MNYAKDLESSVRTMFLICHVFLNLRVVVRKKRVESKIVCAERLWLDTLDGM